MQDYPKDCIKMTLIDDSSKYQLKTEETSFKIKKIRNLKRMYMAYNRFIAFSESNDNDIQINVSNLNEVKKCLILKTQKSNNWKLFPTVPPINKLEMDVTSLDIDNNEIVNIESYGHFDIMDSVWADTFHKFVSEGSKDRSPYNIDKYHKYLSDKIIDYNDDEEF